MPIEVKEIAMFGAQILQVWEVLLAPACHVTATPPGHQVPVQEWIPDPGTCTCGERVHM